MLARAAAEDLDVARLAEAHLDAVTIVSELDGPEVPPGSCWGVWAAESSSDKLIAEPDGDGWRLTGRKPFCSGAAGPCTHALLTAHADDGRRLFAVDLADEGLEVTAGEWQALGMRGSAAATVDLHAVPAVAVGGPETYLDRAGFWHGAIAVAAAWFGGAVGVAAPLRHAGRVGRLDDHGLAHLGAVDADLAGARALLREAAAAVDVPEGDRAHADAIGRRPGAAPSACARSSRPRWRARCDAPGARSVPGPQARDAAHAQRVADLEIYVRQSHAERDLATLGELAGDQDLLL